MKEEDYDKVLDTNLKGAWNMSKHAAKYLLKSPYGRVINISSVTGLIGNIGQTNYSASKAGLIGFTKSLARELASRSVTVNAICPGFIETDMTAFLDENLVKAYLNNIPLKRMGKPEDVGHMVSFLASDLSNYITGQTLVVDGGMVM
jgi:3-oxoacyl-[acyl-carrier protein] reductase